MSTDAELQILIRHRHRWCRNDSPVVLEFLERMMLLWLVHEKWAADEAKEA